MLKNAGFERDGYQWSGTTAHEMVEHLGVNTSHHGGIRIADGRVDGIWTEGADFLKLWYSRPSQSGIAVLDSQGYENSSGTFTTKFGDWVSD